MKRYVGTFWKGVQPRFLYLRLRTDTFHVCWAFPLWVLEESLALVLALTPLLFTLRKAKTKESAHLWPLIPPLLIALLTRKEGLLRLPAGEIFVAIETPGVHIEIGQL